MADVHTEIRLIEFVINPDETICNLFYTSSEPDNPVWGGGWKHKQFSAEIPVADFCNAEVPNYLYWDSGKLGGQFK